ncbi:MAG: DUF547 domain-containing protein [Thermodesulfobacteriota bacterium]
MKPYVYIFPTILFIILAISNLGYTATQDKPDQLYGKVLDNFVQEGLVDYSGLKSNPKDLNQYLEQTSGVTRETFEGWSKNEQLAFLINLYNAQTLDLIADNYPVKSIKDIASDSGGPWEQPIVTLFGEQITLDALENEVIRKNYTDPRVHFALVCAALGCPALINTPYQAAELEKQLDQQTKAFLMDTDKNSIDTEQRILRLSPIFDWFKEDFSAKSGSVLEFVNPYFGNQANNEYKIEYTNYDWSLNDQTTMKRESIL